MTGTRRLSFINNMILDMPKDMRKVNSATDPTNDKSPAVVSSACMVELQCRFFDESTV